MEGAETDGKQMGPCAQSRVEEPVTCVGMREGVTGGIGAGS